MNKDTELLNFIETKKIFINKSDIDWKNVYMLYTRALKLTVCKINKMISDISLVQTSIEVVHNIFWIIYLYTQNIKLCMFLCERSTVLLSEYISLSDDINILSEKSDINLLDIKLFLYKKTVGPLNLYNNKNIISNENIKLLSKVVTNILIEIISFEFDKKNIDEFLTIFFSIFNNILYKMAYISKSNIIENILSDFKNINTQGDLINNLNLKKVKLEIYYYICSNYKDKHQNLYNQVVNNISNLEPYNYFDNIGKEYENQYFKNIVKIVNNISNKYDLLNN